MSLLIYIRAAAFSVLVVLVQSFLVDLGPVARIWSMFVMLIVFGVSFAPDLVLFSRRFYDRSGSDPEDATTRV